MNGNDLGLVYSRFCTCVWVFVRGCWSSRGSEGTTRGRDTCSRELRLGVGSDGWCGGMGEKKVAVKNQMT